MYFLLKCLSSTQCNVARTYRILAQLKYCKKLRRNSELNLWNITQLCYGNVYIIFLPIAKSSHKGKKMQARKDLIPYTTWSPYLRTFLTKRKLKTWHGLQVYTLKVKFDGLFPRYISSNIVITYILYTYNTTVFHMLK